MRKILFAGIALFGFVGVAHADNIDETYMRMTMTAFSGLECHGISESTYLVLDRKIDLFAIQQGMEPNRAINLKKRILDAIETSPVLKPAECIEWNNTVVGLANILHVAINN